MDAALELLLIAAKLFGTFQSLFADAHAAASSNDPAEVAAIRKRLDAVADALAAPPG